MTLPRKQYIDEHVRLVRALKTATPAALKAEAREQAEDLKEARSGRV